jgi:hypothetical protein
MLQLQADIALDAAYHEAGHAVMAWVVHLPMHEVSLARQPEVSGLTACYATRALTARTGSSDPDPARAIIVAVAGTVAEVIRFGTANEAAASVDERLVMGGHRLHPDDRQRLSGMVEGYLGRRWPAVETLVAHLVASPTAISGHDAEDLIEQALAPLDVGRPPTAS